MEYFISLFNSLQTLIAFFFAIGIVIFVHEFGHYLAARLCGLHVEAFSVGFGPSILNFIDKRGTKWRFSLILLGGYVLIPGVGDEHINSSKTDRHSDEALDDAAPHGTSPSDVSVTSKIIAVAGGPLANFILAIVLFAGMITHQGFIKEPITIQSVKPLPESFQNELLPNDEIQAINGVSIASLSDLYQYGIAADVNTLQIYTVRRDNQVYDVLGPYPFPPLIDNINLRSPADIAGLKSGDVILSVNGESIQKATDLGPIIAESNGNTMPFVIWRNGEILNVSLAAKLQDIPNANGEFEKRMIIGVSMGLSLELATYLPGPIDAIGIGLSQTYSIIMGSIQGLTKVVTAEISSCNLQGPIGIAQMTGSAAQQGWDSFIFLIAVLSAAIGFINLLPIPILDGGHLVFYGYTKLTGQEINQTIKKSALIIGIAIISSIFVFTIYNDLTC